MNFGERLRSIREDKDMTQQQVADLIPMNQSNYSKLERNLQQPSLHQLTRIIEIFDITLDELLNIDSSVYLENKIADFESEVSSIYEKYFKK
ncbi:MAG: helix-turn-helix transcriptional regulator [Bacilli bacterium]|nr:helix-turn-helix transcriptional regulator [Bacilli bacterium]